MTAERKNIKNVHVSFSGAFDAHVHLYLKPGPPLMLDMTGNMIVMSAAASVTSSPSTNHW